MSNRKDTKLLFEGWRKFLTESEIKLKSEAEEAAESPESESKKIIRVYDFDNTLVEKIGVDPEELFDYVKSNGKQEGDKINVSTNPDKPSMRTEAQIKTADLGFYSMFFTIKSKFLPLYEDFKQHKASPDTYILSKLTLPEAVALNKDNLIYQWFEEKFGGSEKGDSESKTIGDKRRKAIAQKVGIGRAQVILAKKKDAGIEQILGKYKPEDVTQLLCYDNSADDLEDIKGRAGKIIGADKISVTKV